MKNVLKGLKGWIKSTFSGSNGEASSKRQLMAFLIICFSIAFLRHSFTSENLSTSKLLIDALVSLIYLLGGATVVDGVAQILKKKNDSSDA
jgi:uncharacterized membrane protein HdeD (DUF308 family)